MNELETEGLLTDELSEQLGAVVAEFKEACDAEHFDADDEADADGEVCEI